MGKRKFVPFNKGFYALRRDTKLVDGLEQIADDVAAACNEEAHSNGFPKAEYATSSRQGARKPQGRWRTTVITSNAQAMINESRHKSLQRNINKRQGG